MLAVAGLVEQVGGAAAHDIDAVIDEVLDRLDQPHFLGLSVHNSEQDHAEAFLHGGVLEELIEDDLRFAAALEFDNDAHAFAAAFVAHVGNVFDGLVVDQIGNAFDQLRLVHLVGDLGDDDRLLFFGDIFDGSAGAHHETAATSLVGIENAGSAVNDAVSREVGAFDDLQNLRKLCGRVIDQRDGSVDDLREIVRRNLCGHADGNSVGAIE